MSTTIDKKFTDRGRHYRLEVTEDATVRLRLRCQRRWYVVASSRLSKRGTPIGAFPWELRRMVRELLAAARATRSLHRESVLAA